jgi:hypothetical protein
VSFKVFFFLISKFVFIVNYMNKFCYSHNCLLSNYFFQLFHNLNHGKCYKGRSSSSDNNIGLRKCNTKGTCSNCRAISGIPLTFLKFNLNELLILLFFVDSQFSSSHFFRWE